MKASLEARAFIWALLAATVCLGGAFLLAIPIRALSGSGPANTFEVVTSPELIGQGQQFFAMSCSECHGDDAHGDEGPDLHNLAISNTRIATTIKRGIKGEMPTFAKKYDDHQIAALVSYLRSLR